MGTKKKAAPKKDEPQAPRVIYAEIHQRLDWLRVPVDYEFLSHHLPKLKVKDLVVIAMAMGGRMRMGIDGATMGMSMEFDLRDSTEAKP